MFLKSILNPRYNLSWTIFHCVLGALSTITPFALIAWFYLLFFTNLPSSLSRFTQRKDFHFLALLFYLISFELLDRMAKTSPFLPYELGKYMLLAALALGLLVRGVRFGTGMVMALLITPAAFYDFSGQRMFFDLVNNYFGPLSLALGLALFYRSPIQRGQLDQLLRLIWLTCLSSLIFTYLKTPDFDEISFSLKAQFDTTGGHSSNQVSTILGLGMFLSFYSVFQKLKFSGKRFLDILIMLGFTFQGLLSFSRGGMITGLLGMFVIFYYANQANMRRNAGRYVFISIFAAVSLFFVFNVADRITGGKLMLRYKGETEGTYGGHKEKTADVVLSGRLSIFSSDFNVWLDNPLLGVGAGSSAKLNGVASHIELSRLLADHGVFGLIFFLLTFYTFYRSFKLVKINQDKALLLSLFLLAVSTSFHAAMRTFLTPAFVILSTFSITYPSTRIQKALNESS
jgi:hypothetical protein